VFAQIISNLIMNSLIHGFEDVTQGAITIEVTLVDASLTLIYRDNGKGIAADHLPKIFEPFFTTKRGHHSIGLGLHIVYNLVTQQLHGVISCESTPGQGTTFAITIPGVQVHSPHPE
jgi:signal transduction histidine kinase